MRWSSFKAKILSLLSGAGSSAAFVIVPLLAESLNINYFELGLIGTIYGFSSLVSPYFFGRLSDITGKRKVFVETGFLLSAVTFFLHSYAYDFLTLTAVRVASGFSIGIFTPSLIAYVSQTEEYKNELGMFSALGSLGWLIGFLIPSIFKEYSFIFIASSLFFLTGFFAAISLEKREAKSLTIQLVPTGLLKKNMQIYLPYFLRHTGASAIWLIFPLFLKELGINIFWIGIIFAINPFTQFFIMNAVPHLSKKISEVNIVRIGLILSVAVFIQYSLSRGITEFLLVQMVLGVSWSMLYVGSIIYLVSKNIEKATSTGILNSVINLSSTIGPMFGGIISSLYSFRHVMWFAAALTAIALPTTFLKERKQD